jgi:uncharacterized repeat protein (TIGR01451 family)
MKTKFFGLVLVLALLVTLGGAIAALGSTAYQGVGLLPSPSHPVTAAAKESQAQQAIIIDHTCTDLGKIPEYWIDQAKAQLRLSYGHTSHGSQPISGMEVLRADPSYGGLYDFNTNGAIVSGTLSLDDYTPSDDLGHDGDTSWAARTRTYLDGPGTGSSRNVVIWSWCGGVSDNTEQGIDAYLSAMSQLEEDYPDVTFVYMTGHLDGSGETGNLNVRNNQIRDYCIANNKVLFDFADIESYDPDGNYYLDRGADDNCDYDGGNWAVEWCVAHPGECSSCSCAHSQSLNCDLKARAFWWMLARLAGWDGITEGGPQKTASTKTVMHGQTVTYTVTIRDLAAPLTATVYLTDEIPTGLIYASGTLTATTGTVTDTDAPTLRWSGVLTPTPAVTVTYAAAVTAITPQVITNSAVIAAPGYQPITRTATITVVQAPGLPDLTPSFKVVSSPYADYGERITYTVVVRNAAGPMTDTVHFTDTIMSGLSYVPGTLMATTGTFTDTDTPTLRWSGVLTPTPAVTVTYAATVTHVLSGTATLILPQVITNTAVIAVPGYQTLTRTATVRTNWQGVYLPLVLKVSAP